MLTVSGDDQTLTITGDDGETGAVFGGGEVPDDFPIPMPSGGVVQSVIETPQATLVILEYPTSDHTYGELVAFYEDFSEEAGVVVVGSTQSETAPRLATWSLERAASVINIVITDAIGDVMLVQLSVEQRG
jgi:hypothetical protein